MRFAQFNRESSTGEASVIWINKDRVQAVVVHGDGVAALWLADAEKPVRVSQSLSETVAILNEG